MSRIRIRNFGPIKGGLKENEGWIDISKVTVFIGNQGSGKSTVAKLISTFIWVEKALIRGDIHTLLSNEDFLELLSYHRLENYMESNSIIEYEGDTYHIKLTSDKISNKQFIESNRINTNSVNLPKIMYVPAERNFLSSIENINKVSNLISGSLQSYSVEFRNAQLFHKGKSVKLPINNTKVVYDGETDENFLEWGDKRLKLSEASSGFHSIVPLYWVTKYLADFANQEEKKLLLLLSPHQTVRRNNELKSLNSSVLDEKELRLQEKEINDKYVCKYFVNIVEEPEQNLFPSSQHQMLNSLLEFNNDNHRNKLIMTTHSPYLINFLTLAVKAQSIYEIMERKKYKLDSLEYDQMKEIIPTYSTIQSNDLVIYELDEKDGSIKKLETFNGLPSDENELNEMLGESNEQFAKLLEIQQGL